MGRSGTKARKSASARTGASKARRKPRRVEPNAILATISSAAAMNPPPGRAKYPLPVELRARAIAAHNRGQFGLAQQLTKMAARLEGNAPPSAVAPRRPSVCAACSKGHKGNAVHKCGCGKIVCAHHRCEKNPGTFPPGARVLIDGRHEAIVRQAFPKGSSSYAFPHYKVDEVGGDKNVAVAMKRVGVKRLSKNPAGRGLIRVSRGPVRAAAHVDGFAENFEGCKRFHGVAPNRVTRFDFDDGKEEVTEQVVFALGDAEVTFNTVRDEHGNEIQIPTQRIQQVYRVRGKRSSKAGRSFVHSATEDGGKPSLKVCDARTHILSDFGNYIVDDFIRERRA